MWELVLMMFNLYEFSDIFYSGKPILFPNVTYSFYDVWADLYRIPYVTCALDDKMMIKKEDYFKENGGIVIPNPNDRLSV